MSRPDPIWTADGALLDLLAESGLDFERVEAGAYLITLTGERRRCTLLWLLAGEQAITVEAFVLHVVPDVCSDPSALHRWLLRRNLTLREVHFALDEVGDLFLVGSIPVPDAGALDRLLGEVLALLEDATPTLETLAYGDRLGTDEALAAKARVDGAGRRPAGTPLSSPRRDVRR